MKHALSVEDSRMANLYETDAARITLHAKEKYDFGWVVR